MAALIAAAPKITDRLCDACAAHFAAVRAHLDAIGRRRTGSSRPWSAGSTTTRARPSSSTGGARRASSRRWAAAAATTAWWRCSAASRRRGSASPSASTASSWPSRAPARPPAEESAPIAVVVGADPADTGGRLAVATRLRDAGLAVRADLSQRKLGRQLEAAVREGAHFAVILGDELADGRRPAAGPRRRRRRSSSRSPTWRRSSGARPRGLTGLTRRRCVPARADATAMRPRSSMSTARRPAPRPLAPAASRPDLDGVVQNPLIAGRVPGGPPGRRAPMQIPEPVPRQRHPRPVAHGGVHLRALGPLRPRLPRTPLRPHRQQLRRRLPARRGRPDPLGLRRLHARRGRARTTSAASSSAGMSRRAGAAARRRRTLEAGPSRYHEAAMTEPAPSLATPYRTHTCGALRGSDEGRPVRLAGWVHRRRDHGQLVFLDLRDRHGITQVVVDAADAPEAHAAAARCRTEFVVTRRGRSSRAACRAPRTPAWRRARSRSRPARSRSSPRRRRRPSTSTSPTRPVDESVRLQYRYLDIRREPMLRRLLLRSQLVSEIRRVHEAHGFVEVETPILIKSTPGGRPRLHRPLAPAAGDGLRPAPEPPAAQAAPHGRRDGSLLPDRPLLPRRGPPRRPPARVHPARPRDELRDRGDGDGLRRGDGDRGLPRRRPGAAAPAGAVPALHLRRGARAVRLRQARPALRHGARRTSPRCSSAPTAPRRRASASSTTRSPRAGG